MTDTTPELRRAFPPRGEALTVLVPPESAPMVIELLAHESSRLTHLAKLDGHPGIRRTHERQASALLGIAAQLQRRQADAARPPTSPPSPVYREPTCCPYCGRVMSNREAAEQGSCNDCAGGPAEL